MKLFYKKEKAIEMLANSKNDIKLFSKDYFDPTDQRVKKNFLLASSLQIYQTIATSTNNYYYENIEANENCKLFIDIDYKLDQDNTNKYTLDYLINTTINLFTNILATYNYNNIKIIILNASTSEKLSAHLIFPDVVFKNIKQMKDFISTINHDFIDLKIIDKLVYKVSCFRMLFCEKINKNNKLIFYKGINYNYLNDELLFLDCLLLNVNSKKLINYHPLEKPIYKKTKIYNNFHIKHEITNESDLIIIQQLVNLININHLDNYNEWIQIGMAIKNSNINGFEIWLKLSKKSSKFISYDECLYKWNTFSNQNITIKTLHWYAKKDTLEEYNKLFHTRKFNLINTIKFNQNYLFEDQNESLKNGNSFIAKTIKEFILTNSTKMLAIKSPYNTGKTRLIEKILSEFNIKRVLFVSYRKTLTKEFEGAFDKFNLKSYLNKDYNADKLICQVDSLLNLQNNYLDIPSYDLIILDEIESILNHFNTYTLKNKQSTFDYLNAIINNSEKYYV